MNLFSLSWKYIKGNQAGTVLNVLLLSFGIGIMVVLLLLSHQVQNKLTSNAKGIDLVVGAKGSPLQIILSSVYHIDFPTGNIPLKEAAALERNRLVKGAIPLALGDSHKGVRVVGTTAAYIQLYSLELQEGVWWNGDFEVTIGSMAAQKLGLRTGDSFFGEHGMAEGGEEHEEHAYRVVGVLKPTGLVTDHLILTSVASVWKMHNHEEAAEHEPDTAQIEVLGMKVTREQLNEHEVTSVLITYRSPLAAVQLPRKINSAGSLQAASPAFETARLLSLAGTGVEVMQGFAYLIILMAGLSIFIALYHSLRERRYDLAMMRSLGASRLRLMLHIVTEGLTITLLGAMAGLILGHAVVELLARLLPGDTVAGITGLVFLPSELAILALCLALGIVASLLPAISAYKTDISDIIAKGA